MNIVYRLFNTKLDNPRLLNIKKKNIWENISGEKFLNLVKEISLGLKKLHFQKNMILKKNELVGLIAPSSPTWLIYSYSIMARRLVPVPTFVNISHSNLEYQIKETGMRYIFISGKEALATVSSFLPKLKKVIYHDLSNGDLPKKHKNKFIALSKVRELGVEYIESQKKDTFLEDLKKISGDEVAVIIYTSGSTGEPKGVMLTHKNLLHQVDSAKKEFPFSEQDYAISCLPLAHIFEHTIINFYISLNLSIYFVSTLSQLGDNIREIRPTMMTVVPRILSKVYEKMSNSHKQQKGLKKILLTRAIEYAENHPLPESSNYDTNHKPIHYIYEKLVYKKFRQALGDNFRILVNGGAALPHKILRFFRNIGINLVEGYGLTETSPVIAANSLKYQKPYTVGPPFSGVKVKIEDGEILTKSPSVMKGYYKKPKLTKEVITKDGWFKTGDLGDIDGEGNVIITGRKKDLYKLSNGKYIAPLPLEQNLELSPYVDTALVVADEKKYVSALLFMNVEVDDQDGAERSLRDLIKKVNTKLNSWEKIIKFKPIWKQLSIEEGEITPKMNIRRSALIKKYSKEIESLYE